MKVRGQTGGYGDPVQLVVVKGPALVHVDTVMGHHALAVIQIQQAAKVIF